MLKEYSVARARASRLHVRHERCGQTYKVWRRDYSGHVHGRRHEQDTTADAGLVRVFAEEHSLCVGERYRLSVIAYTCCNQYPPSRTVSGKTALGCVRHHGRDHSRGSASSCVRGAVHSLACSLDILGRVRRRRSSTDCARRWTAIRTAIVTIRYCTCLLSAPQRFPRRSGQPGIPIPRGRVVSVL